jgi:5-methylthioadenosine/S-adenosylhomocysteine deaminase
MRLVIRGGHVIDTEPEPVLYQGSDVLIEDGRIAAVGQELPADGAEVIDARDRIVLPGFVDTHRHIWQTGLRGLLVDDRLPAYLDLVLGRLAPGFRPEDIHVANLAGALECLDAGVTTVQDFSHAMYSPEHADAAIAGLTEAGVRAVFGLGYPTMDHTRRRPDEVRRVRKQHFAGDGGLLTMAYAPVGPAYSAIDLAEEDWRLADELDLPIVVHMDSGPNRPRPINMLAERGLLRSNTVYVHGNSLPDEELRLIADSGAAVSIAPAIEAQMIDGGPMVNRLKAAGITTGLGVDVVTSNPGDMFSVMRATLMSSWLSPGEPLRAAEVLRLATMDGARALGLADRVGSLRPGKQADIVMLRADAPNLVGAQDLIGAVVSSAHAGNVDTVLVAGQVVKRDGRLLATLPVDEIRASAGYLTTLRQDRDQPTD